MLSTHLTYVSQQTFRGEYNNPFVDEGTSPDKDSKAKRLGNFLLDRELVSSRADIQTLISLNIQPGLFPLREAKF